MEHMGRFKLQFSQIAGLGVVLALLLVVACGAAATSTPAPAPTQAPIAAPGATATPAPTAPTARKTVDKLVILLQDLGNEVWNPAFQQGSHFPWRPLHARLVSATSELKLDPANSIINKWELADGGRLWKFTVRDGVKFHNGEELDVDDAVFSQRMINNEESTSVDKVQWARAMAQHATKTGPNTFETLFTDPQPAYLTGDMSEIMATSGGVVFSKDYYESVGGEDGFQANPGPGAAGPFDLVRHSPRQELLFERFDDYYLRDIRPYPFRQMSVKPVPELSTRVAALVAGEADIISADLNVMDQIRNAGGQIVQSPEGNYIWIWAHHCHKPTDKDGNPMMCNDKRVRQALDYAIDKEAIQQLYGADVFKIAGSPSAVPSALGWGPNVDPYPYDPEKAKQLLAEAGYPGGQGFNGGRTFNVWTFPGQAVPMMPEVATFVCSQWNKVLGINCEVKVGEEAAVKKLFYDGEIDGQYQVRPNDTKYDAVSQIRSGFAVPDAYGSYVGDVDGPKIVNLLATIGTQEEVHRAYNEVLSILQENHYDFTPGYLDTPYGVSQRIASWKPWPIQAAPTALWTIEFK